ncbi:MAG: ROK family protein [Bacilli bacterium]|nr:ROK family protein [Bacilli bacterium]
MSTMKTIGVDIGGSSIKGGFFVNGHVHKRFRYSIKQCKTQEEIFSVLFKVIGALMKNGVSYIGIISAGDIDPDKGVVTKCNNIPAWNGARIKDRVEERFGVPVYVENDAIGALIGECSRHKRLSNITMIMFGTGIGGASLINGKIDRTDMTKWGHMELVPNGRECTCGKKGCAEAYLSVTALKSFAKDMYGESILTKEILERYKKGDEIAKTMFSQYAVLLNLFLRRIDEKIHPELIVLGGGIMESKEVFEKLVDYPKNKYCFSSFGGDAGFYGASKLGERRI